MAVRAKIFGVTQKLSGNGEADQHPITADFQKVDRALVTRKGRRSEA